MQNDVPDAEAERMKNSKGIAIHPFLFAAFPILFLYSHNVDEVYLVEVLGPGAVVLSLAVVLRLMLSFLCKDKDKAALLLSLFVVYFFSYDHAHAILEEHSIAGWRPADYRSILVMGTTALLVAVYLVLRTRKQLSNFTKILNVTAVCLVTIPVINIVFHQIKMAGLRDDKVSLRNSEQLDTGSKAPTPPPNIYYIILDEYTRHDILKESLGHDNSQFLEHLEQRGFFVAKKSYSNYPYTAFSLPSSLNFDYLDMPMYTGGSEIGFKQLRELLEKNRAFEFLKGHGYSTVLISTGTSVTDIKSPDIRMGSAGLWWQGDFVKQLIGSTPLSPFGGIRRRSFFGAMHYRWILNSFDHLVRTTQMETPIFVFAHIVCPHGPYVFDEEGNMADNIDTPLSLTPQGREEEHRKRYVAQVKFVSKKAIEVVDSILTNSSTPPIIILQSDHGIRSDIHKHPGNSTDDDYKQAFAILNAYYLPGSDYSMLYESITPVNTFRMVFNRYFGTNYELLEDQSYVAGKPVQF